MPTTYRYLFADLLTNTIIAELPLTGVSFGSQLNQAGSFQGHILLSGINTTAFNITNATIPAKCAVYVDRDGTLVWGGIIWNRSYQSSSQTLTINAREFESYFEKRRITSDQVFTNIDQLTIAQNLISLAQGVPYGNIGVEIGVETSGVLVSKTYYGYEKKTYYSALQDLSRAENGFDFNIDVAYNGSGAPIKTLNLGYPRIGTTYSSTNPSALLFEFPAGNIVEYEYPEDGSLVANTLYALGAGSNEGKLSATYQDTTYLTTGWALYEEQANYSDVTDATYLAQLAQGQVKAFAYPPTVIKLVAPAFVNPIYGTYSIGDSARLRITDSRFPSTGIGTSIQAGLDKVYRIVGIEVQPGESGPERVTLTLTTTTN
jgi:hypothetical protein